MVSTKKATVLDRDSALAFAEFLSVTERERFTQAATGRIYVRTIERAAEALRVAARAQPRDESAVARMRADCELHTRRADVVWLGLETVAADVDLPAGVREAAGRVLEALGTKPTQRTRAGKRFTQASAIRAAMADREPDLALLPLAAGGARFADLIERMCVVGAGLTDDIAAEVARGRAAPPSTGGATAQRLQRLNGVFTRARTALRDEVVEDPALPRDLEAMLFDVFDGVLAGLRTQARAPAAAAEPAAADAAEPAEPAAPPAG